jgi:hypothetical protein
MDIYVSGFIQSYGQSPTARIATLGTHKHKRISNPFYIRELIRTPSVAPRA